MRKLINCLTLIALAVVLTGCCCPCCKKATPQNPQETPPQEQHPSN